MSVLVELLYDNFFALSFSVGLGIVFLTNKSMERRVNLYFGGIVLLVLLLTIADAVDYWLSLSTQPCPLRDLTSAIGYTFRPAVIVLVIVILLRRRRVSLLLWLPLVVLGILAFTSKWTHLIYWFDENNCFMHGTLYALPSAIGIVYMILMVALTLKMYRYTTIGEVAIIFYMVAVIALSIFWDIRYNLRFLLSGTMLISCSMYYIFLCTQTYRRDILTGLPNRRSFYADVQQLRHSVLTVICVDMNGLKEINDSQGHLAGDRALQLLADTLAALGKNQFLPYRVGGDEYVVLGKEQTESASGAFVAAAAAALQEHGISASFGSAVYHPGDNFDEICNRADAHMYEEKAITNTEPVAATDLFRMQWKDALRAQNAPPLVEAAAHFLAGTITI